MNNRSNLTIAAALGAICLNNAYAAPRLAWGLPARPTDELNHYRDQRERAKRKQGERSRLAGHYLACKQADGTFPADSAKPANIKRRRLSLGGGRKNRF